MISKELRRNATCILILNLALGDLLISLVVNSFAVVGVMAGKAFFDRHMFMCEIVGALCLIGMFLLFFCLRFYRRHGQNISSVIAYNLFTAQQRMLRVAIDNAFPSNQSV